MDNLAIVVRTPEDAEAKTALRDLVRALRASRAPGFNWSDEGFAQEWDRSLRLGALVKDVWVGLILARDLGGTVEISLLGTHPDYQRRGIMLRLLQDFLGSLRPGCEVWLETHIANVAAQKVYERLGFSEQGRRPRYYADGGTSLLYTYFVR
jgi:ribosomal protein S18 acetylase RimI-like enzyme